MNIRNLIKIYNTAASMTFTQINFKVTVLKFFVWLFMTLFLFNLF